MTKKQIDVLCIVILTMIIVYMSYRVEIAFGLDGVGLYELSEVERIFFTKTFVLRRGISKGYVTLFMIIYAVQIFPMVAPTYKIKERISSILRLEITDNEIILGLGILTILSITMNYYFLVIVRNQWDTLFVSVIPFVMYLILKIKKIGE